VQVNLHAGVHYLGQMVFYRCCLKMAVMKTGAMMENGVLKDDQMADASFYALPYRSPF